VIFARSCEQSGSIQKRLPSRRWARTTATCHL
jgi:hypothetical protein